MQNPEALKRTGSVIISISWRYCSDKPSGAAIQIGVSLIRQFRRAPTILPLSVFAVTQLSIDWPADHSAKRNDVFRATADPSKSTRRQISWRPIKTRGSFVQELLIIQNCFNTYVLNSPTETYKTSLRNDIFRRLFRWLHSPIDDQDM
jgi:hypothetical protein